MDQLNQLIDTLSRRHDAREFTWVERRRAILEGRYHDALKMVMNHTRDHDYDAQLQLVVLAIADHIPAPLSF